MLYEHIKNNVITFNGMSVGKCGRPYVGGVARQFKCG